MKKLSVETLVGQAVIAGAVALAFVNVRATSFTDMTSGERYTLTAHFDDIGGLALQAPVRSAGVSVGRVVAVALDSTTHRSTVTLEIDGDVRFPSDSVARVLNAGLLGEQYIGIDSGADRQRLNPGQVMAQTQSAVVLERVIEQFVARNAADRGDSKPGVANSGVTPARSMTVLASAEANRR